MAIFVALEAKMVKLGPIDFQFLIFDPFFAPRPHMGSIARMEPKPPQVVGHCPLARPSPQPIGQNRVHKIERPDPPPL